MKTWDISIGITPDMTTWPSHDKVEFSLSHDMTKGDACNSSYLRCNVHTGTHVDAPFHFIKSGKTIDLLSLGLFVGPSLVVEILGPEINSTELDKLHIPDGTQRILFKTKNSQLWKNQQHAFSEGYVFISTDGAEWLVKKGIALVGIDYLSVQKFRDKDSRTHNILLGAGIPIVEGLNLNNISPGPYELICLPLKIIGSDGAPARAILRTSEKQ